MILVGIADDYRFVGPAQAALDAAAIYRTRVAAAGHAFQTSKSWIFSHDQDTLDSIRTHPLAAEIIATNVQGGIKSPQTGLRVLGAPLGHLDWCRNAPSPKRDFILSLGFALQRANSRMLRDSDRRRRNARACGKYSSGTRPLSPLTSPDDY